MRPQFWGMLLDGDWTQSLRHAGKHSSLPLGYTSPLPNHNLFKNLACHSSNMISVKKTLHIWLFLYGIILEGTKKKRHAIQNKQKTMQYKTKIKIKQWKSGGAKGREIVQLFRALTFTSRERLTPWICMVPTTVYYVSPRECDTFFCPLWALHSPSMCTYMQVNTYIHKVRIKGEKLQKKTHVVDHITGK